MEQAACGFVYQVLPLPAPEYRADEPLKLRLSKSGHSLVGSVQCDVIEPLPEYLERVGRLTVVLPLAVQPTPCGWPTKNITIADMEAMAAHT